MATFSIAASRSLKNSAGRKWSHPSESSRMDGRIGTPSVVWPSAARRKSWALRLEPAAWSAGGVCPRGALRWWNETPGAKRTSSMCKAALLLVKLPFSIVMRKSSNSESE